MTTTTTAPIFSGAASAKPHMLKGDSLLDFVNDKMPLINRGELTRTDMIKDAGYMYDNGNAMYTQFYTELLNAKGVTPTTNTDIADQEYDDLSESDKDLYDKITDMLGEKWTHEETIEFMEELDDIGITTPDELENAYYGCNDEYHAERHFAEEFVNELESIQDSIIYHAIDWQAVWDHQLKYDFNTIETSNGTFFFCNN